MATCELSLGRETTAFGGDDGWARVVYSGFATAKCACGEIDTGRVAWEEVLRAVRDHGA